MHFVIGLYMVEKVMNVFNKRFTHGALCRILPPPKKYPGYAPVSGHYDKAPYMKYIFE